MGLLDSIFKKKKIIRLKDSGGPIVRYRKSFVHAIEGYIYALKEEHNMIIILLATIMVIISGLIFNINSYEWLFCILSIGLVSASEMINTAIEATIDLAMPKIHPLAKIAKDCASTATLIFAMTSLTGAFIIFLPKILDLL